MRTYTTKKEIEPINLMVCGPNREKHLPAFLDSWNSSNGSSQLSLDEFECLSEYSRSPVGLHEVVNSYQAQAVNLHLLPGEQFRKEKDWK